MAMMLEVAIAFLRTLGAGAPSQGQAAVTSSTWHAALFDKNIQRVQRSDALDSTREPSKSP